MRRPVFVIFANAMILLVIFALLAQSVVILQRVAVADRLTGQVLVQRAGRGSFRLLQAHAMIKTGDVVQTAEDGSAEFRWLDGTRWKIMPGTTIVVKKATYNSVRKAETSQLSLSAGKVFIRIVKALRPESRFEVETPTAVAAVRGTIFSVEVREGRTLVDVYRGHVQVSNSANRQLSNMIAPGQEVVSQPDGCMHTLAATSESDFLHQTSIIKPELRAALDPMANGRGMIRGVAEPGGIVTINGSAVPVLGNGVFLKRVKLLPAPSPTGQAQVKSPDFVVTVTDRHGGQSVLRLPSSARPGPMAARP